MILTELARDLRFGVRSLRRTPGFTLAAIVTLALGIGANSAMFSVVDGVLLRPLPYPESDRLVRLDEVARGEPASVNYLNFIDWKAQQDVFEAMGLYRTALTTLTGRGPARHLIGAEMSADAFAALRVQPALGRGFRADDEQAGATPVVLLGHGFWRDHLGGDPAVLQQTLTLDGQAHVVLGVMPAGFAFPIDGAFWKPTQPWRHTSRGGRGGFGGVARLRPGISLATARAALTTIAARLEQQYPDSNRTVRAEAVSLLEHRVGGARRGLWILLGAAGLVLLIACANVAGLQLARAVSRERELAVRAALGATRPRIIRQVLTESLLLALGGTLLALLLAAWGISLLQALAERWIPRVDEIALDGRALAFAMAIAALSAVLSGIAPALRGSSASNSVALRSGVRLATGGRLRPALVVVEVALTVMLLVGAGLLLQTFRRLMAVHPGYTPDRVLTMRIALSDRRYRSLDEKVAFYDRWLQDLRALPGVQRASLASQLPLDNIGSETTAIFEDRPEAPPHLRPPIEMAFVDPGFFQLMGIPLLRGRTFTDRDDREHVRGSGREAEPESALNVVIIDEASARRHWPGQDPLGRRIRLPWGPRDKQPVLTVVGVVGRVKLETLREPDSNRIQAYFPMKQSWQGDGMIALVQSDLPTEPLVRSVRALAAKLDPEQPIFGIETLAEMRASNVATERVTLLLVGAFAGLALRLAVVGLYGVLSYRVEQRRREIGVRVALGAQRQQVMRLVVGQGLRLAALGIAAGLAGALALTRVLQSLLFEVRPTDPATYAGITALVLVVTAVASYLPGRRAAAVDPMVALRSE
jgi:putative ABC transport system permease protein